MSMSMIIIMRMRTGRGGKGKAAWGMENNGELGCGVIGHWASGVVLVLVWFGVVWSGLVWLRYGTVRESWGRELGESWQ